MKFIVTETSIRTTEIDVEIHENGDPGYFYVEALDKALDYDNRRSWVAQPVTYTIKTS